MTEYKLISWDTAARRLGVSPQQVLYWRDTCKDLRRFAGGVTRWQLAEIALDVLPDVIKDRDKLKRESDIHWGLFTQECKRSANWRDKFSKSNRVAYGFAFATAVLWLAVCVLGGIVFGGVA